MKKYYLFIFFLFSASVCLSKENNQEIKKNGWNFGPLPCVTYNSDLGFQYGVCADIFNYRGVFPDYRQRFYVELSRYTKGQTLAHVQFDSKYLIPGIRTTFSASYQYDPLFQFFGLCGVEPYDSSLDLNKETKTARYSYKRSMVRVLADFRGNIAPSLSWTGGLSYWYYKLSDISDDRYDSQKTLFWQMRQAGVFSASEAGGGHRIEIKGGIIYDTRDNESAPEKGIWSEAYLNGSPDFFGDKFNYLRLSAHWRHYVGIIPDRLVFAYHLAFQGTLLGQAPFYTQQNISTLFLRQTCTDGLGGINTVRGILAQRLVGDSYAWTNVEFRVRLFSFNLLNQSWYVALNPLFDAGMVTRLYKGEELARFYGKTVDELKKEAVKLHCSAGAGLKLAMNRNFIVSLEYAKPFVKTDGPGTIYIALNYIF